MWKYCGVVKDKERLNKGIEKIRRIKIDVPKCRYKTL